MAAEEMNMMGVIWMKLQSFSAPVYSSSWRFSACADGDGQDGETPPQVGGGVTLTDSWQSPETADREAVTSSVSLDLVSVSRTLFPQPPAAPADIPEGRGADCPQRQAAGWLGRPTVTPLLQECISWRSIYFLQLFSTTVDLSAAKRNKNRLYGPNWWCKIHLFSL